MRSAEPARARRAFTALEVLIAAVLMSVVLLGGLGMFGTGSRGMTRTAAHASARDDALRIMNRFGRDLDRLVVGDDFDTGRYPSVVDPLKYEDDGAAQTLEFYAYHHRRFHLEERRMELVGHRIRYQVRPRTRGEGVDLLRNGEAVNRMPLHSVSFHFLDREQAGQLGVSPEHAVELVLRPWMADRRAGAALAEGHAQARLFHLRNVESQYACLLSLKRAGAPYPILAMVPDPPKAASVQREYDLDQVPLDWLRPLGLVAIERGVAFDDATENQHEEVP